ncbi:hypothetical protein L211DRAFT_176612 [Terfezia boudieri ATCC MYA-4762]|uniref:C2 domain-containing protein n=1 Tax=Terfezia boudieri ATCC MYA-4762 TaxID=1051890 RepID=A0A3N4M2P4_9PEZI|nr:hypothetical protein L211DRAFT_176612 [Terfezia boudieri ATCC MYA-4762]
MARVGGSPGGGSVLTTLVPRGPGGAHPAGIFSDLSVDGPVIGTLVLILDRGKNLPNRKTLGKQDPYCVARLGKEAKRTESDKRGGQTPKWDKELRFEVRDSPDYRTLKLSCFNDDKKTDLIGECIVRLDKILISGGGQDDGWRQLHFRGKYAGEIRVEITFYDLREKKLEPKRGKSSVSDERGSYQEGESAYDDTQEEPEVVTGPRALVGMGQLSQARRERDKERRRQKEAEFKKEREKERMKKEPTRRALPSEPSIPSIDPNTAEAKKKEQKLREREKEERRKRRETYAGEYEVRDRDEYLDSRRLKHTRGMSHSPIPPPPRHSGRGGASPIPPYREGASPIPPHRGGASPIPPHRGGASPMPPHRGGASPIPPRRGEGGGPSPILPQRGGASPMPPHRGDRGHSPIPPNRGNSDPRGHSPIPPHRGNSDPRGHSPIPPHRGNSDPRGHSPIPHRRGDDRGGQSPIPPIRTDRGGHSPIPPNRRQITYEMYGDQYHTDYDDMDDSYGGQLALTHSHSHSLPPPPPPLQQSHQVNHPMLPPLQTIQPLYGINANSSQAQLYSNPNSSQVFNHPNDSFASLPSPDGPPPPPPPHRHMQGQPSNPQLRNQLPQPPQPPLLKHQESHLSLQHKPSQMQLATVQKQPTGKLKHQASVADWAATQEIEIDPRKIPAGAIAVLPKVGQLKQRPRAPSSTYSSAPDFEALAKADVANNDEFDDTGRFAPGAPPPKPMPRVTPNPNIPTDINAGALVPAGYNYTAADPPGYWKQPPFGNPRPRSDSDSTAMVITSQKQRPPPPQYNSAANSRRNSFIGDNPIPPSLIPGIDPTLADLIADDERREKEMALAAVSVGGSSGGGLVTQQNHQQQQPHVLPPAPYIEEVNDREDGGRRKSANGAAGLQLVVGGGKGPGVAQAPQLASTAEGGHQAQVQAAQLSIAW